MSEIKSVRPDILDCLANLSSDEVFTPPKVVNEMLDMLPQDLFENPKTRFLDPFTKSGVFLREIVKRLDKGLVRVIPDKEDRLNHIFQRQVYGIACTQLTALFSRRSLYCNKNVLDKRSTARGLFSTEAGNIGYHRCHHTWVNGSCKICGASKKALSESKDVENYAYPFLHDEVFMDQSKELGFDVIIGNPPYQMSDGGGTSGAVPIYNRFIEQALRLNPRYLSMIVPARWYGGGRGLDEFRDRMINDRHIRVLHDFLDASECFGTGVEIKGGICYFLWNRDNPGKCKIHTHNAGEVVEQPERFLCEEGGDVFIRYALGVSVYNKVHVKGETTFETLVSSQKPFGLRTFVHGKERDFAGAVKLFERGGIGYIKSNEVEKNMEWVNLPKVLISAAYNAGDVYPHQILGKPIVAGKGSCCTETYIVIGPFKKNVEAENVASYIRTKFFRFMVMLKKSSQHAAAAVYSFVPVQDFSKPWTDAELYKKYKLTDQEIEFIESMIRPME